MHRTLPALINFGASERERVKKNMSILLVPLLRLCAMDGALLGKRNCTIPLTS